MSVPLSVICTGCPSLATVPMRVATPASLTANTRGPQTMIAVVSLNWYMPRSPPPVNVIHGAVMPGVPTSIAGVFPVPGSRYRFTVREDE